MTQEDFSFSDQDSLLPKDNIKEVNLLQLPKLLPEEPRNSPSKTPLTQKAENLSITPTDKPTVALND